MTLLKIKILQTDNHRENTTRCNTTEHRTTHDDIALNSDDITRAILAEFESRHTYIEEINQTNTDAHKQLEKPEIAGCGAI